MASKKSKKQDAVTVTINQPAPGAPAKLLANGELTTAVTVRGVKKNEDTFTLHLMDLCLWLTATTTAFEE